MSGARCEKKQSQTPASGSHHSAGDLTGLSRRRRYWPDCRDGGDTGRFLSCCCCQSAAQNMIVCCFFCGGASQLALRYSRGDSSRVGMCCMYVVGEGDRGHPNPYLVGCRGVLIVLCCIYDDLLVVSSRRYARRIDLHMQSPEFISTRCSLFLVPVIRTSIDSVVRQWVSCWTLLSLPVLADGEIASKPVTMLADLSIPPLRLSGQRAAGKGPLRHVRPLRQGDTSSRQETQTAHQNQTENAAPALERNVLL